MDPSFIIPRIITELIFPGISSYFAAKNYHPSWSNITPAESDLKTDCILIIERLNESLKIGIEFPEASETDKKNITGQLRISALETPFVLQMITGREIKGAAVNSEETDIAGEIKFYVFTIGLRRENSELVINIYLPGRFFNILIPSLNTTYTLDKISDKLIPFFRKPDILCPSIEKMLEKLKSRELADLLDLMTRKRTLSDYQLVLLINGFPGYSLKIKDALSKNRQESLKRELKKYRGRVTRDDISCGIYSIEESLGSLLKRESTGFTDYFRTIAALIRKISDYELYMRKSWDQWLAEMEGRELLYKSIIRCSDSEIKNAFSDYKENRYPLFKKFFSDARIGEIFEKRELSSSGSSVDARVAIIKQYRSLLTEKLRLSHESFTCLLSSINHDKDFELIVRNTGWYILSTALKQCSKKLQEKVTGKINHPASLLIRGVISGTINPDIIHDEIQINRARGESVRIITELYEDGFIELDF